MFRFSSQKFPLASWSHSSNIFKLSFLKDTNYSQNSPTILFALSFFFCDPDIFPIPTPSLILGFYLPFAGESFKDLSYLICLK